MEKLVLQINENVEINYGANIDELAFTLQKYSKKYLYVDESMTIKFVDKFIDLPYENCRLIAEKKHGYLLYEESTDRVIQVFDKYLSLYLIGEISEISEKISASFDIDLISGEKSSTSSTSSTSSDTEISEEISTSSEEITLEESTSEISETSDEETPNKEEFSNMIKNIFLSSISYSNSSNVSIASYFRIYLKSIDDNEYINAVYVNNKILENIEKENDIDLGKTIELSFSSFLKKRGYDNVKIGIEFYENVFGEVVIYSNKEITNEIIQEIEENAILNVNTNDIIFFIHREKFTDDFDDLYEDDQINDQIVEDEIKYEIQKEKEKYERERKYEEAVYSLEVPLTRLPVEFCNLVLRKTHDASFYKEKVTFYFQNSEFLLKNEGLGFYSLFDKDLLYYFSHLHPDLYPNAYEYSDLPLAQFYY
jgi:hypothetical protein